MKHAKGLLIITIQGIKLIIILVIIVGTIWVTWPTHIVKLLTVTIHHMACYDTYVMNDLKAKLGTFVHPGKN